MILTETAPNLSLYPSSKREKAPTVEATGQRVIT